MRVIRTVYDNFERNYIEFNEPTMAQQHFRDEADINNIMAKFVRTGILPTVNASTFHFYDGGDLLTYHEACQIVAEGNEIFAELPAKIRKRFDNDPANYLAFFENPENEEEAIKLGLAFPAARKYPNYDDNLEQTSTLLDVTGLTDTNSGSQSNS